MDHRMPIKDGITAMKEILEIDQHAKFLFASADHKVKEEALRSGARDFLTKPFNYDLLIQKIRQILHME